MTDLMRQKIWTVVNEGFSEILQALRETNPRIVMDCGYRHTAAFLFRAYAQYTAKERVIVISLDIKATSEAIRIWGDLSRENGDVLKDLIDVVMTKAEYENRFLALAKDFVLGCQKCVPVIGTELR